MIFTIIAGRVLHGEMLVTLFSRKTGSPYSSSVLLALAALKPSEFWDAVGAIAVVPKLSQRYHVFAELGSARLVPQSWWNHRDY